jgi:hypothetical protein
LNLLYTFAGEKVILRSRASLAAQVSAAEAP